MIYNGIWFNEKFWAGKPLAQFIEEEKTHRLTEKQAKEAHGLMQPKADKAHSTTK